MGEAIRVALVGCGRISQIMHLPHLIELPGFEVVALCDVSKNRRQVLADRYAISETFEGVDGLLASSTVEFDAAVVATPSHTHLDVAAPLLEDGVHLFMEKPLATTPEDGRQLVSMAQRSDHVCMIGYMKRFEPAFQRLRNELDEVDRVDAVTVHDFDPAHDSIIDEVYDLVEADLPEEEVAASVERRQQKAMDAIGVSDPALGDVYARKLDHLCHMVNILHTVFGTDVDIDHVDVYGEGRCITATLRFSERDVRCLLNAGYSRKQWFEEFLRLDTVTDTLTLEFQNPFLKNRPAQLVKRQGEDTVRESKETPSSGEAFKRELRHFRTCIDRNRPPRTGFRDAYRDLEFLVEVFRTAVSRDTLQ